jgi:ubiquinone/menaquinone biosynthesis C-methylase UbiE
LKNRTRIVIDKVFWTALSRFSDSNERIEAVRQRVENALTRLGEFGAAPPAHVLDAGCNTGTYTLALAQTGYDAVGIDFSGGMVERATRKAEKLNLPATFEKMDLDRQLWFADGEFDHVLCTSVLHLLPRPEWTLGELYRVTRPQGLLLLTLWLDPEKHREAFPQIIDTQIAGKDLGILKQARKTANIISERTIRARYWKPEDIRALLVKQGYEVLLQEGDTILTLVAKHT